MDDLATSLSLNEEILSIDPEYVSASYICGIVASSVALRLKLCAT
jgi:hypothetical protein